MEFKHLEEVLQRYGKTVATEYARLAPEATGNLAGSVMFSVDHRGIQYKVILDLLSYWKYVEYGRRAGKMPPIQAIMDWIKVKPVIPREINGQLPTERQLAFLIARSIGENGTEGKHVLEKANTKTQEQMIESIKQAFLEDIGEDMDKVLALMF